MMKFQTVLSLVVVLGWAVMRIEAEESPLRITEFAAGGHQGVVDEDGDSPDWIEIRNISGHDVSLTGWTLSDESPRRKNWPFPALSLAPGGYAVVFASGKNRRDPAKFLHTNFKLGAREGSISLIGPGGVVFKVQNYPQQVDGVSFGLAASGTLGTNYYYLAAPTPGKDNSPPLFTGPSIRIIEPRSPHSQKSTNQTIPVTAQVVALTGSVAQVQLAYRVMFGPETKVPMLDDGKHGDGAAGDGVFGASIPGDIARAGQMVRYYVSARDTSDNASRWPLFANRKGYSAYEGTVYDDPTIESRLPIIHLFTPNRSTDGPSERVAIFYEGEFYDAISISQHGQISRGFPKRSLNVNFPVDHHFRYQTNAARVSDLKLLANYADKSKIRNTLAYEMLRACGSLGHFAFHVRIQHNGKFYSVAEAVEDGGDRFLERIGLDPQGALYKMYGNLHGAGEAKKKTRTHENQNDLQRVVDAVSEDRPLADRVRFVYDEVDIPQCVSYFAAMAIISSADHGHKNYYLYRDTRGSGEWALLPWDVDLSWGRVWTGNYFNETITGESPLNLQRTSRGPGRNPLYNIFFEDPDLQSMYLRRLRTLMDELLLPPNAAQESLIEKRVRELTDLLDPPGAKLSDAQMDDAAWRSWGQPSSMRAEADKIREEYLPERRDFLFTHGRAQLLNRSIPSAQPANASLKILTIATQGSAGEQFVCVTNHNNYAVDISGWTLDGAGVQLQFRPGTVVPQAKAIYAVASVKDFRTRKTFPKAGKSLFVQGNWKGKLDQAKGPLKLLDVRGRVVESVALK